MLLWWLRGKRYYSMLDDKEILSVCSPKDKVSGPYEIVYKTDYWAIVTLKYESRPRLGIRWFTGKIGTPSARGNATWFVLPEELYDSILSGLPLKPTQRFKIDKFLIGE